MNTILYIKHKNELIDFCKHNKRNFLYGAGFYGKMFKDFLEENGIEIEAFLVTHKKNEIYCNLPVFCASEMIPFLDDSCGIILSLSSEFHKEILGQFCFPCPVCCVKTGRVTLWHDMRGFSFLKKMQHEYGEPLDRHIEDGQKIIISQVEFTYGDVIWSTAFLRELRRNLPKSKITMVVNKNMMSLLTDCPYIDEVIPFPLSYSCGDLTIDEVFKRTQDFCKQQISQFDVAFLPRLLPINPCDLWENVFVCMASGARIRLAHAIVDSNVQKIMARKFKRYFSCLVLHDTGEHETKRMLSLLPACGLTVEKEQMELWLSDADKAYAKKYIFQEALVKEKTFIALGVVGTNPARSWSPQLYNDLIRKISKKYSFVVFFICGGKDAVEAARIISNGVQDSCFDLSGKTTLTQVAAIISCCDMYIGSDTGLMHMAAAFGKPIIEISYSLPDAPETFGSHPVRTGPWCVPNVVLRPPYGLDECKCICRKKYAHCINLISPKEVFLAFESLFDSISRENRFRK